VRTLALAGLVIGLTLCVTASAAQERGMSKSEMHIRGTVYAFADQDPIEGATVRVAELGGASAITGADGTYDLIVPDGTAVTPYVEAPGYHGIYLQTFVTVGHDFERVNFQIPSDGIYAALAALLGVELDAGGNQVRCAIVSTLSTVNVRYLSFPEFIAYGAHGVAGATAAATPALPDPVYFNEAVIPDQSRTESSVDGGVIWTEVPRGVYRIAASHPTERFAEFTASCEPGRLINANPPQGLHQLEPDETVDRKVSASIGSTSFEMIGRHGRVFRLRVRAKEYVAFEAELVRRGKTLADTPADRGAGAFDSGKQRASLRVGRGVAAGPVKLRVAFADAAGNLEVERERLRLPKRNGARGR
jgi:hypothetical protein